MSDYLYFPGGPGLSAIPDIEILSPFLGGKDFVAWSEPSRFRPEGDRYQDENVFSHWLSSASHFLKMHLENHSTVICHSFSSLPILSLLGDHSFSKLILLAPALDFYSVQKRICGLAERDFLAMKSPHGQRMKELRSQTNSLTDESMIQALKLALEDPNLFGHYWQDTNAMMKWASKLADPRAQIDLDSWEGVLIEHREKEKELLQASSSFTVPTLIVGGSNDPIIEEKDWDVIKFSQSEVMFFEDTGHFPHLEKPKEFVNLLSD